VARSRQLKLGLKKQKLEFGGKEFKNYNPNSSRPLAVKTPIHVVMRAPMARAHLSMLFYDKEIRKIIKKQSEKSGVKIHDFANSGNHLHFVCTLTRIDGWKAFIRAVSGLIARTVLGAERGKAIGAKFWEARPWTRILAWGRAYKIVRNYIGINKTEAFGFSRKAAKIMDKLGLSVSVSGAPP